MYAERRTARRVAERQCTACDWTGEVSEIAGDPIECPQCHGQAELVRVSNDRAEDGGGEPAAQTADTKNPHAAALGRLGGLKGGRARADALSATRRRELARKAARALEQKEAELTASTRPPCRPRSTEARRVRSGEGCRRRGRRAASSSPGSRPTRAASQSRSANPSTGCQARAARA
jgi:hypothetical protein